jgi:hypothetical protein
MKRFESPIYIYLGFEKIEVKLNLRALARMPFITSAIHTSKKDRSIRVYSILTVKLEMKKKVRKNWYPRWKA